MRNRIMDWRDRIHLWSLVSIASSMLATPAVGVAQSEAPTEAVTTLDEVVVTAQRREEKMQDVPIAITAMSASNLRERGVTQLQDIQSSVPSLVISTNGQASREVMSPSIRGQSASYLGAPGVVVYMNEVPLPAAYTLSGQGGPGNFVDLQSVQVLSGVQGTLFGRNTTGGAILLTPAKPTDRFEGHVQAGYGNHNMMELEAVLNLPLTDTLSVRLVGAGRDRDGFTHDVNWNKDRDNLHWRTGRIGLQWVPNDRFSNYTLAYYGHSRTNGTGAIGKAINTDLLKYYDSLFDGAYFNFCDHGTDCSRYDNLVAQQKAWGNRKIAHGVDGFSRLETEGVSNTTEINLTDNLQLRNIASWASLKSYYATDMDGFVVPLYDSGLTYESRTAPRDWFDVYTEELQFQGDALASKLTYTFGGFYFKQKPAGTMRDYAINVCHHPTPAGCTISTKDITYQSDSNALYAQATLDLGALAQIMDGLRFTTGYRYTWDKISGTNSSYSYIPDVGPGGSSYYIGCGWDSTIIVTNPMVDCLYGASRKDKAGTWLLGIDYRPVDSLFVYAKGSRGYKAGGFNTFSVFPNTRTFGPEFVTDYEAGFKSDFYIGGAPVRLNTNIFYLDYSHIQRTAPDYNITTNANGAVALSTASATIKGIEIEVVARPMDFLEVGGNYSHLTSHYKSFRFNSNSGVRDCTAQSIVSPLTYTDADMSCRPLLFLSPKIFSLYGRASIPMSKRSGDLSLFVSYSWTDKQPFSVLGIEKFPDGTIMEPGAELPAFGLVSASIDWRNALGSSFDVSLFGTNLTDKEYLIGNSGVYQSTGAQTQIYGEPRMYGVRVKYSL